MTYPYVSTSLPRRRSSGGGNGFLIVCGVAVLLVILGIGAAIYRSTAEVRTICVNKTWTVAKDNSLGYRVGTTNDGVFQIEDSVSFGAMDSADRYNKLTAGRLYDVKVAGWRNAATSNFPNIVEVIADKGACDTGTKP